MIIDNALTALKSTGNLGKRRLLAWKMLRFFIPADKRIFFEGHPHIPGQLWYRERIHISQVIREYRPQTCFEIGTWKGGGSTFFITRALWLNRSGILHTIELDRDLHTEAKGKFEAFLPQYSRHVEFHLGDYHEVYGRLLKTLDGIDFVILDGPEDAQETMDQFNFFLPHMRRGAILMAHDWFTEKSRLLKVALQNSPEWEIKSILRPPDSMGLVTLLKK